jgi:hypothetical protein
MSHFEVSGARLYHETRGTGPQLLLIPGAKHDTRAAQYRYDPGRIR